LRPLPLAERKKRLARLLAPRANRLVAEALAIDGRGRDLVTEGRSELFNGDRRHC
jgi:hypothetical protein